MSLAQRLPAELREFLSLPGPQSLLIRGPPGSGKTTLCLALLEAASGHRLLLTSRVSLAELNRGFPWLGDNGSSRIEMVDTSTLENSIRQVAQAAAAANKLIDDHARDAHAFSEFMWLPSPIQEAWSRVPADKSSILVIDSWDALIEQYLGGFRNGSSDVPDRAEVERILLRQLGRGRAHVVIVLERREETQLDYLVNGVVVTERELANDRLERWLSLPKLRGIRIANGYYPYTVEGARFQCIEPIRAYSAMHRGQIDKEPDAMPGHLWPGSRAFAENFGRLPLGKTTLIETDGAVEDPIVQMLLGPMIASAASAGGRALLIPSPSLSAKDLWDSVRGTIPHAKLQQGFRAIDVTGQLRPASRATAPEFTDMVFPLKALAPTHPAAAGSVEWPESEISRFMTSASASGGPLFAAAHVRGLLALSAALRTPITPETADSVTGSVQAALGGSHLHLVIVGREGVPLFEAMRPLGSLHIHLRIRQGRVFAYGSKPWTPGFVLAEGTETSPYDLLRIV
jgi:KaiC/GvpD/RAD55 family RecA-like ATPase